MGCNRGFKVTLLPSPSSQRAPCQREVYKRTFGLVDEDVGPLLRAVRYTAEGHVLKTVVGTLYIVNDKPRACSLLYPLVGSTPGDVPERWPG